MPQKMGLGFGIGTLCPKPSPSPPPAPTWAGDVGLVAAWNLDEAPGTRVDSFGTNHLTPTGTVGTALGRVNTAAVFDGNAANYLSTPSNVALQATGSFWLSAWVCRTASGTLQGAVGKYGGGAQVEYLLWVGGAGTLVFDTGNGVTFTAADSGIVPNVGEWYFLLGWYDADAGTVNLRVNGGPVVSGAVAQAPTGTSNPLTIGAGYPSGFPFPGQVGPVFFGKPSTAIASVIDRVWLTLWADKFGQPYPVTEVTRNTVVNATFTAANGTSLDGYSPDTGAAFSVPSGSLDVQSNRLHTTGAADNTFLTGSTGFSDMEVSIDVIVAADGLGPVARATDENNRWTAYLNNSSNLIIYRTQSGTTTNVASAGVGATTGRVAIRTCGDQIVALLNGVEKVSYTSTFNINGNKAGASGYSIGNVGDNFTVQDWGTPNFGRFAVADRFNAVNGTTLDGRTPDKGPAWADKQAVWGINGGRATLVSGAVVNFRNISVIDSGLSDAIIETSVIVASYPELIGHFTALTDFLEGNARIDSNALDLRVTVANVDTAPVTDGSALTAGTAHTLRMRLSGPVVSFSLDGTAATVTTTAPTLSANTKHGIGQYAGAANYFDNFTVQSPITLIQATFTAADGTDLNGHVDDSGRVWTVLTGAATIQSNKASFPITPTFPSLAVVDAGTPDVTLSVSGRISSAGTGQIQGIVRCSDENNLWVVTAREDGLKIFEIAAGVATERASVGFVLLANTDYTTKVVASGSVLVGTLSTGDTVSYGSMATGLTNTKVGVRCYSAIVGVTALFDNFTVTLP